MSHSVNECRPDRPIGYYVHHHGRGHLHRAISIARQDLDRFVLLGTELALPKAEIRSVSLPDDRLDGGQFDGNDTERNQSSCFHYAPIDHDGVRTRMAIIADWIAENKPSLLVSDVSVEVAFLARLCSTPVVYVRLSGSRIDTPHLEVFRASDALIAPFAEALEERGTPDWVRRKTIYAPGLTSRAVRTANRLNRILFVCGSGGSTFAIEDAIAAALRWPQTEWRCIGVSRRNAELPSNLSCPGWIDEPELEIAQADVVVGGAGDGLVSQVLAQGRPFVCIPEPRPFGEQSSKAQALKRLHAAVILERWPSPDDWMEILADARQIDSNLQQSLHDESGPSKLYRQLRILADRQK